MKHAEYTDRPFTLSRHLGPILEARQHALTFASEMKAGRLHNPDYQKLSALLRQWREEAGLTQRDLAAKLKVARSQIHKCETSERRVDAIEFAQWASATDQRREAVKFLQQFF